MSGAGLALVRAALASKQPLDPASFGLKGRELRELLEQLPELEERVGKS